MINEFVESVIDVGDFLVWEDGIGWRATDVPNGSVVAFNGYMCNLIVWVVIILGWVVTVDHDY